MALEEADLPQHLREQLREALNGGRMLLGLIEKLLDFARLTNIAAVSGAGSAGDSGGGAADGAIVKPRPASSAGRASLATDIVSSHPDGASVPIDFLALTGEALDAVGAIARRQQVEMVLTVDPKLWRSGPPLAGDAAALKQVLIQLLENAVKHNRQGGEVAAALTYVEKETSWASSSLRLAGSGHAAGATGHAKASNHSAATSWHGVTNPVFGSPAEGDSSFNELSTPPGVVEQALLLSGGPPGSGGDSPSPEKLWDKLQKSRRTAEAHVRKAIDQHNNPRDSDGGRRSEGKRSGAHDLGSRGTTEVWLRIAVADTGVGIPKELQKTLLKPFGKARVESSSAAESSGE